MEITQFKINDHTYSVPICEIEQNGDLQIQLDQHEWNHNRLILELPGNLNIQMNSNHQLEKGALYLYWGENGRLYLSGKGFKAKDIIHRKIGNRLIVKSKL